MSIYKYQHQSYLENPLKNVLATASTISSLKTASRNRELRDKRERGVDAGVKLRENTLNIQSNLLAKENVDESTQGGMENSFIQDEIETLPQEEVNKLKALAPEVSRELEESAQAKQMQQSLSKYYQGKGASKEESDLRASGFTKDIDNFSKEYRLRSEEEQVKIKNNISQAGAFIQNIMETAKLSPETANKMFLDYRNTENEEIKQLYKNGDIKKADKLQLELDKMPNTLINQDGSFNAEFPMIELSKLNKMLTTTESFKRDKEIAVKQQNRLALEEEKQGTRNTASSKQERLIKKKLDLEDKIDNDTITAREKKELILIDKSMEKNNQIREGVSERGMTKTNDMMSKFSESVNSTDFFDFSDKITRGDVSISGLSTTQKKDLGILARREQSVTKNRIDKDDKSTLSALKQTTNVIDVMKGADFTKNYGPVDKFKDDILKYFRGDTNAAKAAMISAFHKASTVNANIKGVPSNADLKLISEGLADKTMNEDQAAEMMVAGLEKDLAEAKDTLDRAIVSAPATAIFKYGDVVSDLKSSINIIKQAFKQEDTKESSVSNLAELRGAKKSSRQSMYDQIKAKRPNATDAQINNYLTSKGY